MYSTRKYSPKEQGQLKHSIETGKRAVPCPCCETPLHGTFCYTCNMPVDIETLLYRYMQEHPLKVQGTAKGQAEQENLSALEQTPYKDFSGRRTTGTTITTGIEVGTSPETKVKHKRKTVFVQKQAKGTHARLAGTGGMKNAEQYKGTVARKSGTEETTGFWQNVPEHVQKQGKPKPAPVKPAPVKPARFSYDRYMQEQESIAQNVQAKQHDKTERTGR